MTNNRERASLGWLDPIDRISEILFGLIMVLTSTGTLSVITAGRAEVKTMILGALGCNLAWGIIDAGLYLMSCLGERGGNLLKLRTVRQTSDPDAGRRTLADALPAPLVSVLSRDELESLRQRLTKLPESPTASRPDKRRMAGRPGYLPARGAFDHSGHHPIPVHRRAAAGAPGFQRHRDRDALHVRLCVRANRRTSSVADRPRHGRDWRCHGGNRDSARWLSRAECRGI